MISIPVFVIGSLAQLDLRGAAGLVPGHRHPGHHLRADHAGLRAGLAVAGVRRPADADQPGARTCEPTTSARRKAKGLSNARTVGVHTLRNSLIPVITYIGIDLGALMGGAIVTERIFNINGVGNFLYRSIHQKDGVAVVGTITVLVLIFLLANLRRRHPLRRPGSEDLQ